MKKSFVWAAALLFGAPCAHAEGAGTATSIATSCGLVGGPGTLSNSVPFSPQSGTTYTFNGTGTGGTGGTPDCGNLITFSNASGIGATLPQAGTSGFAAGVYFNVRNTGGGLLTVTPTTSTIDGATSFQLAQGGSGRIVSDGANWQLDELFFGPIFLDYATPGQTSLTIPIGTTWVESKIFGGGGGGGSGAERAVGSIRTGGTGGAQGAINPISVPVSALGGWGATVPISVGAAGAGGAAVPVTTTSTNGNQGQPGGISGLGTVLQTGFAFGGSLTTAQGQSQTLAVDYFGSAFVQGGAAGLVITSSTGQGSWTPQTSGTSNQLNGTCHNSAMEVLVGATGTIITSTNLTSWTTRISPSAQNLLACVWNGASFIAVGNAGVIETSPDGATWTQNAYSSAANITDVGYDGSANLVAVDSKGEVITATTATGTWTAAQITASTSIPLYAVAFGAAKWVAVGPNGINYYTATPTGSWTLGQNLAALLTGIRYVNGWFFAGAVGGYETVPYSSDGVNWYGTYTGLVSGFGGGSQIVAYGGGTWVFTKRPDNATYQTYTIYYLTATPTPYSIIALGGTGGAGGANTTPVVGPGNSTGFVSGTYQTAGNGISTGTAGNVGFGLCVTGPGGGSIDAANTYRLGGYGGQNSTSALLSIAAPGIIGGAPPGNGTSVLGKWEQWGGSSGGGGSPTTATTGQSGGLSGSPCAGGAGGSASDISGSTGFASGAGAAGGQGEVRIALH